MPTDHLCVFAKKRLKAELMTKPIIKTNTSDNHASTNHHSHLERWPNQKMDYLQASCLLLWLQNIRKNKSEDTSEIRLKLCSINGLTRHSKIFEINSGFAFMTQQTEAVHRVGRRQTLSDKGMYKVIESQLSSGTVLESRCDGFLWRYSFMVKFMNFRIGLSSIFNSTIARKTKRS